MKEGEISSRSEVRGAGQKKHFNFLRTKEIKSPIRSFSSLVRVVDFQESAKRADGFTRRDVNEFCCTN